MSTVVGTPPGVTASGYKFVPFNPATVPGLSAWYDAADASTFTLTGALVEQWRDKSGNLVTLNAPTSAQRPSRSGTQNGQPTVVFNSHVVRTVAGATAIGSGTNAVTIIVACKRSAASASFNEIPAGLGAGNTGAPLIGYSNQRFHGTTGFGGFTDIGGSTIMKSWCVLTDSFSVSGGNLSYSEHLNGAAVTTGTPGATASLSTGGQVVGIGLRPDDVTAFLGEIAEVLIYNQVLTATNRQKVENYLKTKWGTA